MSTNLGIHPQNGESFSATVNDYGGDLNGSYLWIDIGDSRVTYHHLSRQQILELAYKITEAAHGRDTKVGTVA